MKPLDPRLLRHARATGVLLFATVALGLLTACLAIAQAALLGESIGRATSGDGAPELWPLLVALAVVLGARAAIPWAQEWLAHRTAATVKSRLRRELLARAVMLGGAWSSETRTGEVVATATQGVDALDAYFARYLPQLVLAAIVPVAVVASLLAADLVAALTVALTVPLIPLFMVLIGRATDARRRRRWSALARLSHHFLDVVQGLPTLKIYGRAHAQVEALRHVTDDYRVESLATLRIAFLSAFALELIATLSVALVAVGVGLRLVTGDLALSTGLFVLVLAPEAYLPLRQLGAYYHATEEGLAALDAAFRIIDAPVPTGGDRRAVPPLRDGGELRVEDVSVDHPEREITAPARASLVARPGELVAVSGSSGAGKTTLLHVILGLRRATTGRVIVRGQDGSNASVDELDGDTWRRHVAWLPQEPFLFAGTIVENARLAAPDASDEDVTHAMALVGLGDVDPATRLGERGTGLSSGQRRRLGLVRALLRDADLLLLDEPTAGLDAESESRVLRAIREVATERGVAVILVAHRPAALAIADRVVSVGARPLTPQMRDAVA